MLLDQGVKNFIVVFKGIFGYEMEETLKKPF